MIYKPEHFVVAANKAVKNEFRVGGWKFYEHYKLVETENDVYVVAQEESPSSIYQPLAAVPGLFLEFAGLVDEGEITQDVWLDWIRRYGVLGFEWRKRSDYA